jgi:hypothetical protein
VANDDPKIEKILDELIRRIRAVYPNVFIQRGFAAEENTIWPAIYIMEDVVNSVTDRLKKKGLYDRTALVYISYFFKGPTDMQQSYGMANVEKFKLCSAVETDEGFNGLCTHYGETEFDKVFYKAGGIQLSIGYQFEFSEEAPWVVNQPRRM